MANGITMSARVKFCHVNVSKWGKPFCDKYMIYSCKIHFGSCFASLLKVRTRGVLLGIVVGDVRPGS